MPKVYAKVNLERPPEYSNVDNFKINWSSIDDYRVVEKIGRGKYSEVFRGVNTVN
jgi:casein kinase II subunit alpha